MWAALCLIVCDERPAAANQGGGLLAAPRLLSPRARCRVMLHAHGLQWYDITGLRTPAIS
jgi:hypothetical protein